MNAVTVTRRLRSLKQCLKLCSLFPQVDVHQETPQPPPPLPRTHTHTQTHPHTTTTMEINDEVKGETYH